jgi:hypothetical protein
MKRETVNAAAQQRTSMLADDEASSRFAFISRAKRMTHVLEGDTAAPRGLDGLITPSSLQYLSTRSLLADCPLARLASYHVERTERRYATYNS